MSKIFFSLILILACFAAIQAKRLTKFRTLSHSKTGTGSISPATKVLDDFGVNQGWTTFNTYPRSFFSC